MKKIKKNKELVVEPKIKMRKVKVYKLELDRIENQYGILTPQIVVEEAEQINSPLHHLFDWNDRSAGAKFRLWQARHLIGVIQVQIQGRSHEAYTNAVVLVRDVPTRGYVSTARALSDADIRAQVLQNATREIKYWQEKYRSYQELQSIINRKKLEKLESEVTW